MPLMSNVRPHNNPASIGISLIKGLAHMLSQALRVAMLVASALLSACAADAPIRGEGAQPVKVVIPVREAGTVTGHRLLNPKECAPAQSDYPPDSLRANEQGTTTVEVEVSQQGQLTGTRVAESSGYPRLDEVSLRLVYRCMFSAAPVSAKYRIQYVWKLE
jgi:TonB family protein